MASIAKDAAASGSSSDPDTRSAGKRKRFTTTTRSTLSTGWDGLRVKTTAFGLRLVRSSRTTPTRSRSSSSWRIQRPKIGSSKRWGPLTTRTRLPRSCGAQILKAQRRTRSRRRGTTLDFGTSAQTGLPRQHVFNSNKDTEYCAPLTSFDWCGTDPSLIVTCSIDTTATVWDLETMRTKTQIIAHDKEAFDVAFRPQDPQVFATCGNDGSMRIFDRRDMEHSHIVYETDASAQGSVAGPCCASAGTSRTPTTWPQLGCTTPPR